MDNTVIRNRDKHLGSATLHIIRQKYMVVATSRYHMRSVSNGRKGKAKNDSMVGTKNKTFLKTKK
jgi:hypothetical protein